MLISRRSCKPIAATFLLLFFTETFAPSLSYALTSGPTQPEVNSFEPIDTTDMVNLATGDFTYNMPLLEVPGPEGGYPLSLSYHAGIQPNMDASWVGLGWTVNPGAVNRSVNGFPDDWKALTNTSHIYWSGTTQDVFSASVNIGLAQGPSSVSFGLSIAHDTYKGFSVGLSGSLGFKLGGGNSGSLGVAKAPFSDQVKFSGGVSHSLGEQISNGPLSLSQSIGITTNFSTVQGSFSYGLSYHTTQSSKTGVDFSVLGATLNSNFKNASFGVGGLTRTFSNSKAAGIQSHTTGFSVPIPIVHGITATIGYTKTRYWTDQTTTSSVQGSLYPVATVNQPVFDNYSLLDDPTVKNIVAYPDPTVLQGGSFPAFDDYEVTAQGLGGYMSPAAFEEAILLQNHKDKNGNATVTCDFPPSFTSYVPTGFRFQNDFSNSYRQTYDPYANFTSTTDLKTATPPFSVPAYGNNDAQTGATLFGNGADIHPAKLEGTRHIDMGVKILPSNCYGSGTPNRFANGMINGFSITNESGVTYHYGLAAYSYNEQNYQEKISRSNGLYFNRDTRNNPYAYTWYLTSITGPDFVDRNNDQKAGPEDWGYWVNFEYGKWSNEYVWRNPSEGYSRDEDNNFQNSSIGYKEIYYLNAIRTRSHIAIFEKDLRLDGKGVTPAAFNTHTGGPNNTPTDYITPGGFDVNSSQTLQLSHIYLLNIADANLVTPTSSPYTLNYTPSARTIACSDCELPQNIIDYQDVVAASRADVEAKAIRVIDFNYDYSLCPGTANSFDALSNSSTLNGKLTLKSLVVRGKKGANLLPPTTFQYDLSGSDLVSQTGVSMTTNSFTTTNANFNVGDMIQTSGSSPIYCGVIVRRDGPVSGVYTYTLANSNYPGGTVDIQTTKNPPYNKDMYDAWGMYKSDGNVTVMTNNENMGRNTTPASAKGVDAWSLRKIGTPLGDYVNINYESDTYHSSVMNNTFSYIMQNPAVVAGSGNKQITFNLATYGSTVDPSSLLTIGQYCPTIELAGNYINAHSFCSGNVRFTIQSALVGGLTINSATTSGGVTTFTGTLDNPIPSTAFQGTFIGLATGNLWINSTGDYLGGGLRVTSISTTSSIDNITSSTLYSYNNSSTGYSSGVTSYTPFKLDALDEATLSNNPGGYCQISDDVYQYKAVLYKNTSSIYPLARELPSPGVMYQYVTVKTQVKNPDEQSPRTVDGSTTYCFEVVNANTVSRKEVNAIQENASQHAKNWVIRKFTSPIGQLKSITQYDNNGAILSQTINHFLHDDLENANLSADDFYSQYYTLVQNYVKFQGFIQERYLEIKDIAVTYTNPSAPPFLQAGDPPLYGTRATLIGRETYPCIPIGQTTVDFVNGTKTSSTNLAFDYYSGEITQKVETDAYGNSFMTESVPAYRIPQYAAMGLIINTPTNKSMLSQAAATYVWKVDGNNNRIALASASATVWSDNATVYDVNGTSYTQNDKTTPGGPGDVWRPVSTYQWMPSSVTSDGLTPYANFPYLNWSAPSSSDPGWKNTRNVARYDVFSKDMDDADVNGNHTAVRMDYGDQKVTLSGDNANYYEIAYSGAEDAGVNQSNSIFVKRSQGAVTSADAHTGSQSLLLGVSGQIGFTYSVPTSNLTAGRSYQASVWYKPANGASADVRLVYDINGTVKCTSVTGCGSAVQKTANGWYLLNLSINGSDITPGNTLNVYCVNNSVSVSAYTDDFRFQPVNSTTTAYVYDPASSELTYTLDNNNVYTHYVYDGVGRLSAVYKEKLGTGVFKINDYQYNYSATKYYSSAVANGQWQRSDCGSGYIGTWVSISQPQGAYMSYLSYDDAAYLANLAGQAAANQQGSCLVANSIPVTVPAGALTSVSFNQGSTFVAGKTFNGASGTVIVPSGTYTVIVSQTNSVSHSVTLPGYGTQSGVSVTFNNVVVPGLTGIQVN